MTDHLPTQPNPSDADPTPADPNAAPDTAAPEAQAPEAQAPEAAAPAVAPAPSARSMALNASGTAAPAAPEAEIEALSADLKQLVPVLWKADTSPTLSALLRIIARARELGADGLDALHGFGKMLRENRAFDDLYILTSELNTPGETRFDTEGLDADIATAKQAGDAAKLQALTVRRKRLQQRLDMKRWEIQALIELGVHEAALALATPLAAQGPTTNAGRDGLSALGRIYKQLFADGIKATPPLDEALRETYLHKSYRAYSQVWSIEQSASTAYYGVNALSVARRAEIEGNPVPGADLNALARDILNAVDGTPDAWSWATLGETQIYQGKFAEAAKSYANFVFRPEVSLFQLNAALRQLEEIWGLDGRHEVEGAPVRVLKTALITKMKAAGGDTPETRETTEIHVSASEAALIVKDSEMIEAELQKDKVRRSATPEAPAPGMGKAVAEDPKGYEQIFANNAPFAVQLLRTGLERATAVCRIDCYMNGQRRAIGTAFAVHGKVFHDSWGDDPVIVTNNHVISSRPNRMSQRFQNCEAVFVNPENDQEIRVEFEDIIWESEDQAHDVTILKPKGPLPQSARPLDVYAQDALPQRCESDDGIGRVYVIGYPMGGPLSFSFADNILLDHDAKPALSANGESVGAGFSASPEPVRMHYKAPTLGGSSGSPVFDFNKFQLIGVHHRGLPNLPRLPYKSGEYAANQGIWIESIRAAIAQTLDEAESEQESLSVNDAFNRQWRLLRRGFKVLKDAAASTGAGAPASPAPSPAPAPTTPVAGSQPPTGGITGTPPWALPEPGATTTSPAPTPPPPPAPAPAPAPAPPPRAASPIGKSITLGAAPPAPPEPTPAPPSLFWPGSIGDPTLGASSIIREVLREGVASQQEILASGNESIIGIDSRVRIFDTHFAPWRMICALRGYWGQRLSVGTGFLVSPNLILTAGHCVFPKERRAPPDRIDVIFGLNGAEEPPYGVMNAARIHMTDQWASTFDFAFDVGAIFLDKPIGRKLGWFGLASRPPEQLQSAWVHVTGYPGEKIEQAKDPSGRPLPPVQASQLWHHRAPVIGVQQNRVFYATDTTAGQSGAPIYLHDPVSSPTPVAIGVHAYGKASTPMALGQANSGPWIDPAMFAQISAWKQEADDMLSSGAMA